MCVFKDYHNESLVVEDGVCFMKCSHFYSMVTKGLYIMS